MLNIVKQIIKIKLLQLFKGSSEPGIRCSFENEYVLVKLESCWYVSSDVAVSFKCKILCLICISERVSEYFVFSAKIVVYNM